MRKPRYDEKHAYVCVRCCKCNGCAKTRPWGLVYR